MAQLVDHSYLIEKTSLGENSPIWGRRLSLCGRFGGTSGVPEQTLGRCQEKRGLLDQSEGTLKDLHFSEWVAQRRDSSPSVSDRTAGPTPERPASRVSRLDVSMAAAMTSSSEIPISRR